MTVAADVLIIGAGPAGTTAAALLAEKGRRVELLEKEPFPRYRLGESLIPYCWYPLDRLGLVERLDASGFIVHKHSVQFVGTEGNLSQPFYFFEHYDHPSSRTWQVVRSEFDTLLLENARAKGARFHAETEAVRLLRDDAGTVAGVLVRDSSGAERELRARCTIDASGRDVFGQRQNRWHVPDKELRKTSIWSYYRGALRDEGVDEGATTIAYLPEKGWFWYLPLADDVVSVGVVAEADYLFGAGTKDLDEVFQREVERQPWIHARVRGARKLRACRATRDFTYRSRHCAEDGLVLVGDAFSFIDPVFSSGVFLALHGGCLAADAVDEALTAGDLTAGRFEAYGAKVREAIEPMRRLVHAFYDTTFNFADFLRDYPEMRSELTDCLIGDLHRDFEAFFTAMSKYASIPEPLPHGTPAPSPSRST